MRLRIIPAAAAAALLILPAAFAAGIEPEKEFSEVKVYSADGRPWRVPVEDWEGARKRIASDPEWRAWFKRERAEVGGWMARRADRVEWVCGWFHDFVSPKDGSHLTWTDKIPGEEVDHLSSPSDPRVEITPKLMAAWVFEFRGKHADMIVRAARLYRLTGERRYADWAAAQLDFYADHYLDWKPQRKGQEARLFWQTLDEATYGTRYAEAVRLLGPMLDPARKQRWWDKFFGPEYGVLDRGLRQIHNIANWHRCAQAQIALVFGREDLWKRAIDGPLGVREQLQRGVTPDYLWYEQSFHYNEFVVEALLTLFDEAGIYGRSQELAGELAVAENLMVSPLYVRFPNGMLPNPADGTGIESAPHLEFLAHACRVFPTTLGLEAAAHEHNWQTLLDPPAQPPTETKLPVVRSRNMESSRMAVLVKGRWQVFLHYGQLTASHSQSEALNFSASLDGVDVTHDPGTVGYGSPFHREYYTRGLNHNVPLIGGEGEVPPQPGRLVAYSDEQGRVEAVQERYRPGVRAGRALQIDGERLVDVSWIRSDSGGEQALGFALHLEGKARLGAGFVEDPEFAQGRPASFHYWKGVKRAEFRDSASFDVMFSGRLMKVTFLLPGPFTVWHGSTPDVPPKRREGFYLETHGRAAELKTILDGSAF